MLFALRLAARRDLGGDLHPRLRALVARLGLPPLPPLDPDALLTAMARDKKARESGLAWVLPAALGEGRIVEGFPPDEVRGELDPFLADPLA
jgi:3-dehydroquinate synthetase